MIETFKNWFIIDVPSSLMTNMSLIFFFWTQNLKWWPSNDEVWFIVSPSGRNQLRLIVDKITMNFLDLKNKVLSNKIV
jgi:hypothetical protein